jgi:hypothetical protein
MRMPDRLSPERWLRWVLLAGWLAASAAVWWPLPAQSRTARVKELAACRACAATR